MPAIGRRVGALSIVHRNHFAEMEENRGISLRPLLSELAAELRARRAGIGARTDASSSNSTGVHTTQDAAVAVAFLITEIVEFAMLELPGRAGRNLASADQRAHGPADHRSPVLVPDEEDNPKKSSSNAIIGGLAKQLRSPLDRKLGRYSVDMPVFPPPNEP